MQVQVVTALCIYICNLFRELSSQLYLLVHLKIGLNLLCTVVPSCMTRDIHTLAILHCYSEQHNECINCNNTDIMFMVSVFQLLTS